MNKAFVKETDAPDADEDDLAAPALPAGSKNYMTPAGYARLDAEFNQLWKVERPNLVETISWAASNGDRSENGDYIYGKKRLREVDRRIRFLSKRLEHAEVVDPATREDTDQVFFGATVTVADQDGSESTYRHRRHRRSRCRARPHRLDFADGARAAEGARRRHRQRADAGRAARGGNRRGALPGH